MLNIFPLCSPIVYDDVVSRITFSLSGSVEILSLKRIFQSYFTDVTQGRYYYSSGGVLLLYLVIIESRGKASIVSRVIGTLMKNIKYCFESS